MADESATVIAIKLTHKQPLTEPGLRNLVRNLLEHIQAEQKAGVQGFADIWEGHAVSSHEQPEGPFLGYHKVLGWPEDFSLSEPQTSGVGHWDNVKVVPSDLSKPASAA